MDNKVALSELTGKDEGGGGGGGPALTTRTFLTSPNKYGVICS